MWTGTIDFGDGSGEQPLVLNGKNFSLEHVFRVAGMHQVLVTITDSNGDSGSTVWQVLVNNVAPVVAPLNDISGKVNQVVEISTSFTDPGNDTHTAVVRWGDGTETSAVIDPLTGLVTASHIYLTPNVYNAVLVVFDGITQSEVGFKVTIGEDITEAFISGPTQVQTGSHYLLNLSITGPEAGTITSWTVNWGDGTVTVFPGATTLAAHIYGMGGVTRTITAFASNGTTTFSANSLLVSVVGDRPEILRVNNPDVIFEGDRAAVVIVFRNRDRDVQHRLEIDWGDGNVTELTMPAGTRRVEVVHPFADNLPDAVAYPVSVRVLDENGVDSSAQVDIVVRNAAPVLDAGPNEQTNVNEMVQFSRSFEDPGLLDVHQATINWGDGTITSASVDQVRRTITGNHIYSTAGDFTVSLVVTDNDGDSGLGSFQITALGSTDPGDPVQPPGVPGTPGVDRSTTPVAPVGVGGPLTFLPGVMQAGAAQTEGLAFLSLRLTSAFLEVAGLGRPAFPDAGLDSADVMLVLISAGGIHSWAPLYQIGEDSHTREEDLFQVTGCTVEMDGGVVRIRVTFSQPVSATPSPAAAVQVTSGDGQTLEAEVNLSSDPESLVIEIERQSDGSIQLRIVGEAIQSEDGNTLQRDWETEVTE